MDRRLFVGGMSALPFAKLAACSQETNMALTKFGFIVTGSNLDPKMHRMSMTSDTFEMIAVGVSEASQGIDVAKSMLADGIQLIELCGGFGPLWTSKVIEAIGGKIPVGSVGYGPESIDQMYHLFK